MHRNIKVRNFGLRSRDATRALITAYQLKGGSYSANATVKTALKSFTDHLKNTYNIKDLRKVEHKHVISFAKLLNQRFIEGKISASTAQNYLSPVNVALENARLDKKCRVEGVKDVGLPTRTGIARQDYSATKDLHEKTIQSVSERLAVHLNLQRELGLRLKESCLIDANQALEQAIRNNMVLIEFGTKGGRTREVPIYSQEQMKALESAALMQGKETSLIPKDQTWAQYQSQVYREIASHTLCFHQERHHYANNLYQILMGEKSPVQSKVKHNQHVKFISKALGITISEAKERDMQVRMLVAKFLGHSRISITNNYLG